jgi:hypothetical protein
MMTGAIVATNAGKVQGATEAYRWPPPVPAALAGRAVDGRT